MKSGTTVSQRPNRLLVTGCLVWLATLGCLARCGSAQVADPESLSIWVQQLDHESLAIRNRAEQQLMEQGQMFLNWLNQQPESWFVSSETKFRLQRIRARLFDRQLENVTRSSRLQMQKGWDAAQCVSQFWQQTGNRIAIESTRFVTPASDVLDFWAALELIAETNHLTIDPADASGSGLSLSETSTENPLAAHAGPLRMEWLDNESPDGDRQVRLRLLWEPRLRLESLRIPMASLNLIDSAGQPWADFNRQATYTIPVSGIDKQVNVRLPVRAISNEPLQHLLVPVELSVIAPTANCVFTDALGDGRRQPSLQFGAASITLEKLSVSGQRITARLATRYDRRRMTQPLQSHVDWASYCTATLRVKDGPEINAHTETQIRQEPYRYVIEYEFQGVDPQVRHDLKFQIPAGIVEVEHQLRLNRPE